MPPTHQYFVLHAPIGQIQTQLAGQVAQGWKPILMSTAVISSGVQVIIVLEKPVGS